MKNNVTKRFIGLIVSLTMMLAYAVPFAHAADSISEETFWTFEALFEGDDPKVATSITADTELDGLTLHANADKNISIDGNSKTIDGESFTMRAKFGGKTDSAMSFRSMSFTPALAGTVTVYYGHASSNGDPRQLDVVQGANSVSDTVEANVQKSFTTDIEAGTEVFIGSYTAALNIYGIKYTPSSDAQETTEPGETDEPPTEATDAPPAQATDAPPAAETTAPTAKPTDPPAQATSQPLADNASIWVAKASDGDQITPDSKGNTAMIPTEKNISSTADMEIYVMEEMPYKDVAAKFVDTDGNEISIPEGMNGRLTKKPSGGTNPSVKNGNGSSGASMKIIPAKNGVLSAYVKVSSGTKHFIINDTDGNRVADYENTTGASIYVKVDASVEAGKIYYAYTDAAGTDYFGFAFEEKEVETPAPAEAKIWAAKASDGEAMDADNKGNTARIPADKNVSSFDEMEIYLMEAMLYKDLSQSFVDTDGQAVDTPAEIVGRITKTSTNPKRSGYGKTGSSLKLVPKATGTASIYVKVSAAKIFYVNDEDGTVAAQYENTSSGSLYVKIDAPVVAGKTYYAYTDNAGTDYFAVAFVEGGDVDPDATAAPTAGPTQGPVVSSDLPEVTKETSWLFEDYNGTNVTETVTVGENNDMKIYGTAKMAIDGSNKKIGPNSYSMRLKFGGNGQFASTGQPTGQVIEINPGIEGLVTVDFAHASSSGDPRSLAISQNGYVINTTEVAANATGTAEVYVSAGTPVYIYSNNGAVNVYGVYFTTPEPTPEPTATPDPNVTPDPNATPTPLPSNEPGPDLDAAQAVYDNLTLKSLSDTSIYFDLDLVKDGKDVIEGNTSKITWESSNEDYIKITENSSTNEASSGAYRNYTGVVTRPTTDEECTDGGVPVTLKATIRNGKAILVKEFDVSVRKFDPYYYNDFQSDVGAEPDPDNKYYGIQDNVEAVNGDKFRGIRVVNFANSKSMYGFKHSDEDLEKNFDKRIMSTDASYGKPRSLTGDIPDENFSFYYSMYNAYGGSTTYMPLWISLADEDGSYPEGLVILNMDIYMITSDQQFSMGFGTSKPAQMCRFMLNRGTRNTNLSYTAGGTLRYFDAEEANDYMVYKDAKGSNVKDYLVPMGKWIRTTIVANSDTHLWDFYFDGIQIAKSLKFRNAEDFIPSIEFTLNRSYQGGAYFIDNVAVENITSDYTGSFWDNFGLDTLEYDEETDTYKISAPSMLPYQGTGGLTGSKYIWRSSNPSVLNVETTSIAVEDLADYGYTEEQIAAYKNNKANYITGVVATPSTAVPESGTYVTVTASLEVNDVIYKKDFKVLVLPLGSEAVTDADKAKADLAALTSIKSGQTISKDGYIDLEETGPIYGSKITWTTSNKSVISADGYVTRPSNTQSVALTATAVCGDATATKKFSLSVKGTSGSSGGGGGGGGGSSSGSASRVIGTLSTPTETFETRAYTPEETANMIFNDIEKVEWAKEAIEALYEKGVVSGYGNGLFAPNYSVTREQFVKMLVAALGVSIDDAAPADFGDVADDAWYAQYVNAAAAAGIVNGKDDGSFGVGESITRQDMAVMCTRALTALGKAPAAGTASFADNGSISAYAVDAVGAMAAAGYLTGDENGYFNPTDTATRAQTAVVLYRIIK